MSIIFNTVVGSFRSGSSIRIEFHLWSLDMHTSYRIYRRWKKEIMMMRTTLSVIVVAGLCAFPELSIAQDALIGEWFPDSTSRGGLGMTREYDTKGVVSLVYGAALKMKYTVEKGKMKWELLEWELNVKGENLTMTKIDGDEAYHYTRRK